MKKKKIIAAMLCILMFISITTGTSSANAPTISAGSAIVMDVKTGRILYSKNMNNKKPMASTTKIMTALLALENSKPNDLVKIHKKAVGVEGSSIYLQPNEELKMQDLIYGLMLRSGNDSAVAIAHQISGSAEDFAHLMNKRAKEIGALNTNFMNPHGLHHDEHYTTAYDLGLISREALLNEEFNKVVQTKVWVAEREGFKYFHNKNRTLSEFSGGDGVKTGFTKAAGRCLVTSATRNGMQLVCVVLNAPNWFQDSYQLLNYAFDEYQPWKVIDKDTPLKTVTISNGKKESTKVICPEDIIVPVTEEEKDKIVTVLELGETVNAPILRGTKLGRAKVYVDNKLLYTTILTSREDIEQKNILDRISNFIRKKS
ncbi:D-alanyl-D-alanine carboxypeptidase family protein [Geosporobacter ferrireducens]|uniref:D-alanyl-D-alanine carboxypeptidase family protein n=1 Tax=Geosporobacter ferrireducens TaxID=1424294 RepID=UPI0009F73109|nr:D-alanyl-D-alanine carboxypeptidase family protein [Geosporobacter ferrireducens]MTI54168.1 D-alanyl-D-alanine carboxypeptidase [Geosporobacter ferrireducens]